MNKSEIIVEVSKRTGIEESIVDEAINIIEECSTPISGEDKIVEVLEANMKISGDDALKIASSFKEVFKESALNKMKNPFKSKE